MATNSQSGMNSLRSNALPWLALSALMIALDQWSKALAVANLQFQVPLPYVSGFWNWTLTHNTGVAFSLLEHAGSWKQGFLIALAVLISGGLTVGLKRTPRADWRTALPFALIIAGALGNLVDRLRLGYVVDFVQWYWRDFQWPVFNLADSCIVVGATLLVLFSFRHESGTKLR
jgi:signal peptidase II